MRVLTVPHFPPKILLDLLFFRSLGGMQAVCSMQSSVLYRVDSCCAESSRAAVWEGERKKSYFNPTSMMYFLGDVANTCNHSYSEVHVSYSSGIPLFNLVRMDPMAPWRKIRVT